MDVMKKQVLTAALAVITLSSLGVGTRGLSPAEATVLDGFAIDTQDKAVTVTLYTDQRSAYTTETQGKQFAIVLPNTELSQSQMENGLPVVIDNKNRFIGRAVPTADGKVKIILPNLSAEEYSVSVQQRKLGQPARNTSIAQTYKPAAAPKLVNRTTTTKTTQVATRSSAPMAMVAIADPVKTAPVRPAVKTVTTRPASVKAPVATVARSLPTVTAPVAVTRTTTTTTVANRPLPTVNAPVSAVRGLPQVVSAPTVVAQTPRPRAAVSADSQFESVASNFPKVESRPSVASSAASASGGIIHLPPNTSLRTSNGTIWNPYVVKTTPVQPTRVATVNETPTTLSVAESNQSSANSAPPAGKDPLWYLHSLPPVDTANLPADALQGEAMNPPFAPALEAAPEGTIEPGTPIVQVRSAFSDLKEAVQALPRWLLITAAIFLAGLGLFGLMGGLVLLRLLFNQARGINNQQPAYALYPAAMMPQPEMAPVAVNEPKAGYASIPARPERLKFEDKASVNAMDYLMDAPARVPEAVHNSVLLKFPGHRTNAQRQRARASMR